MVSALPWSAVMIQAPPRGLRALINSSEAFVDCFHGFDCGFQFAGMADHVGIGEIHDDGVEFAFLDGVDYGVGDARGGHLRLQIVGGHFRRGTRMRSSPGNGFSTPPLKK